MNWWTDERVTELKRLAPDHSASEISNRMGAASRNAILGKIHRLGLNMHKDHGTPAERQARRTDYLRQYNVNRRCGNANIVRRIVARRQRPDVGQLPTPAEAPTPLNCTLVELAPNACHWPVNDGEPFRFCGHPAVRGFAYCAWHARRAYQPSRSRE